MNRTLVFAAAGAFGTALLMAMIISASMGGKEKGPSQEILVATKDLPVGATLKDGTVRWQKWPDTAAIPGALIRDKIKEDDWKDQKVRRALTKGEPVTLGALVREIKGSYLAAALDEGMRAIAIDVKAASGVAGFLAPGDRVDVILIYNARLGNGDMLAAAAASENGMMEKASETIVENVRIMATDQDSLGNTAGGERKAKVNKTVTLEVTPKDAEKIAVATEMGNLHLVLRQLGDASSRKEQGIGTTDLGTAESLRRSIQQTGGGSATGRVRVYSGGEVQEIKIVPNAGATP